MTGPRGGNPRVVLLAAGRGERLRPETDARPKALLEIDGTPLIVRAVRLLAARGLTRITVVEGYRGDMVRGALQAAFPPAWFRFVQNADWAVTNNAYSLHLARYDEPDSMLLLDGDIAFAPEALDRLLDDPRPNRLAVRTRGQLGAEEMKVVVDSTGRVTDIGKEVDPRTAIGESVGLEVFSSAFTRRLFEALGRRVAAGPGLTEFYEASFVELLRSGDAVYPVDLGSLDCVEIDTAEDLENARAAFGALA